MKLFWCENMITQNQVKKLLCSTDCFTTFAITNQHQDVELREKKVGGASVSKIGWELHRQPSFLSTLNINNISSLVPQGTKWEAISREKQKPYLNNIG